MKIRARASETDDPRDIHIVNEKGKEFLDWNPRINTKGEFMYETVLREGSIRRKSQYLGTCVLRLHECSSPIKEV